MPVAIVPEPTTPTVRTGRACSAAGGPVGVAASATTSGDPGAAYV